MRRIALPALIALAGLGCVYYNAMWRAERLAAEARRLEQRGRSAEARAAWLQASVKAESVLARHPDSRWADDALALRAEALVRTGACGRAGPVLEAARRDVAEPALAERVALAAAECALVSSDPVAASLVLRDVLESSDGKRAARARYLAGRAAWARGDAAGALDWYARSGLPAARLARVRSLVELGRTSQALEEFGRLGDGAIATNEITELLELVARAAGPDSAALALDRVLRGSRWGAGDRARLLLADGERLRLAGRLDRSRDRYRAVLAVAADSVEGTRATASLIRADAAAASDTAALRGLLGRLEVGSPGRRPEAIAVLARLIRRVLGPHQHVAQSFQAAELARDSLHAPRLASALFLDLARGQSTSVFAPKALVAALALGAEPRDSILGALHDGYPRSPYTLALAGEAGPAYAVLEDSLAQALGLGSAPVPRAALRAPPPTPGPRGPFLDEVFRAGGERAERPAPGRERPRPRARERAL